MNQEKMIVFTDGACKGNGNGGVGVVWVKDGEKIGEYFKGYKNVTNNKMELLAIGVALKAIVKEVDSLTIVSDSKYALGCLFNKSWNPKKNVNLIEAIKKQIEETQKLVKTPIKYEHTRGHQKDDSEYTKFNNRADFLAQNACKE